VKADVSSQSADTIKLGFSSRSGRKQNVSADLSPRPFLLPPVAVRLHRDEPLHEFIDSIATPTERMIFQAPWGGFRARQLFLAVCGPIVAQFFYV
jgi:hypothetical protein